MFKDNVDLSRFEWTENSTVTFADYYPAKEGLVIAHVETPAALRGTGAAGRLMTALTDHARATGISLKPTCGYAVAWFKRHQDQADVLA